MSDLGEKKAATMKSCFCKFCLCQKHLFLRVHRVLVGGSGVSVGSVRILRLRGGFILQYC